MNWQSREKEVNFSCNCDREFLWIQEHFSRPWQTRKHCFGRNYVSPSKGNICCGRKMFLKEFSTQMLRARANGVQTFASATMFPRLPRPSELQSMHAFCMRSTQSIKLSVLSYITVNNKVPKYITSDDSNKVIKITQTKKKDNIH